MKLVTRRTFVRAGGALLAGAALPSASAGEDAVEIVTRGDASGAHVWFDPVGLHLEPGRSVRWRNADPGNAHTATAYHPSCEDHPLRIPKGAQPWNSDYLLPDETFTHTFDVEGVYDYFCVPHEHAGMVGRIVVGRGGVDDDPYPGAASAALKALPSVREILTAGQVRGQRQEG